MTNSRDLTRPRRIRAAFFGTAAVLVLAHTIVIGTVEQLATAVGVLVVSAVTFVAGWVDGYLSYHLAHPTPAPTPEADDA